MSTFTRLASLLWHWPTFVSLGSDERILWLALYTSPEAKAFVPGLFHGSILHVASAARMPADVAVNALDSLIDRDVVEYDRTKLVLRMTSLPDAGEFPDNWQVLKGWWRRFLGVPQCQIRDAHVPTIRWILDEWARNNYKPLNAKIEEAWKDTFGLVIVPPPRRRGARTVLDSNTSSDLQPGLFEDRHLELARSIRTVSNLVASRTLTSPEASPALSPSLQISVFNEPNDSETPRQYRYCLEKEKEKEIRSSSFPDPECPDTATTTPSLPQTVEMPSSVPAVVPFTPIELIEALSGSTIVRPVLHQNAQNALETIIRSDLVVDLGGLPEIVSTGVWLRSHASVNDLTFAEFNDPSIPPQERMSRWASVPGRVRWAVEQTREHLRVAAAKREALRQHMVALGMIVGDP